MKAEKLVDVVGKSFGGDVVEVRRCRRGIFLCLGQNVFGGMEPSSPSPSRLESLLLLVCTGSADETRPPAQHLRFPGSPLAPSLSTRNHQKISLQSPKKSSPIDLHPRHHSQST